MMMHCRNPLPGPGVQPRQAPDQRFNSTWLFDVFDDPTEEHDLSQQVWCSGISYPILPMRALHAAKLLNL
jgi:hypothetical protein